MRQCCSLGMMIRITFEGGLEEVSASETSAMNSPAAMPGFFFD